jgi:hypothetical protein
VRREGGHDLLLRCGARFSVVAGRSIVSVVIRVFPGSAGASGERVDNQ